MRRRPEPIELTYIYALADPRTDEIGFVGRSERPRIGAAVTVMSSQKGKRHVQWLERLRADGYQPRLSILACVPKVGARRRERQWIDKIRQQNGRSVGVHLGEVLSVDVTPLIYIYALTDPRSGSIGYVGQSANPQARRKVILAEAEPCGGWGGGTSRVHRWIYSVRASGFTPQLAILACVPKTSADRAEYEWIAHYRSLGQAVGNARPYPAEWARTIEGWESGRRKPDATKQRLLEKLAARHATRKARRET